MRGSEDGLTFTADPARVHTAGFLIPMRGSEQRGTRVRELSATVSGF